MNLDYICNGSLTSRRKVCGKPQCRCAVDPAARHGPYYEWGRLVKGKLVHTQLRRQEAERIARAIRNYRSLRRLLAKWMRTSARAILAERSRES